MASAISSMSFATSGVVTKPKSRYSRQEKHLILRATSMTGERRAPVIPIRRLSCKAGQGIGTLG